jgi:hypothetical protein
MFMTVALALACGPGAPGETTAEPESTSGSTTAPEPTATGTTTDAPVTTGEPATTDATTTATTTTATTGATTTAATTDASSTGPPADSGQCVVDPAAGICSESCDLWSDCCKCDGQTIAITDPQDCSIAAGIVTSLCPWWIDSVRLDGQNLAQGNLCDEPGAQWTRSEIAGDIVITLCGDTCAAYLDGKFAELKLGIFCEAA